MTRLIRYGLASLGPVGSAAAQFLLALILLRALDSQHFGSFSFLLVASQLMTGVWGALFCAPLLVLMTQGQDNQSAERSIFAASLLGSIAAAVIFFAIALALGLSAAAAAIFAASVAVAMVRWLARAHAYALGAQLRSVSSDLVYAALILCGAAALSLVKHPTPELAFLILLVAALASLLPFGASYFDPQFRQVALADLSGYRAVWRDHSGWSLIGVVTTEATMNSQAYLVTLFAGPTAFAPIAATSLLVRPIVVAVNALTEFERAQMARHIGQGEIAGAAKSTTILRIVLLLIWGGTAIASAALLLLAPRLVFPPRYTLSVLTIGAASWMVVALVRVVRAPESALLQAAGEFRTLAWASIYACMFSVVSVLVILLLAGPIWSIASILTGEIAFAIWLWRAARRWARRGAATVVPGIEAGVMQ